MLTFVQLLGTPAVQHEGKWFEPPTGLSSALLYYLAYKNMWVNREELAYLFWPDMPETNARKNLRNLIVRIKNLDYTQSLYVERSRISWNVETDVAKFKEAILNNRLSKAISFYKGNLLRGFCLDDALEFENWIEVERGQLKNTWRDAVLSLTKDFDSSGNHAKASEVLESLYQTNPFDEDILRQLLQQLHLSEQRSKALSAYATFQRQLEDEFGAEPETATLDLIEQIKSQAPKIKLNDITPKNNLPEAVEVEAVEAKVKHNLPVQITAFVGREIEQQRIIEQLADPACRLLSIIAPGGMGKTRLSLAAAKTQVNTFKEGVFFIPFAAIQEPEQMIHAIAESLEFIFLGQDEPKEQLFSYLGTKELLLIFDNLEHLLSGVNLISELLENAPKVKVLATSRERLNLQAEWLFDLSGLNSPQKSSTYIEEYDAIKLFMQSARRVKADFNLDNLNSPTIVRICQLVEGMPLAIELAAAWLELLSPAEITQELEQNIDFLTSQMLDAPERQKSIRAVFDSSWKRLSKTEQEAFMNLAIFQGGFSRKAAQVVACTNLPTLRNLVNKSFIITQKNGHYSIHELLRQYGEEQLRQQPQRFEQLQKEHAQYFMSLMHKQRDKFFGGAQLEANLTVELEFSNIRPAWRWSVQAVDLEAIRQATSAMLLFFQFQSRYVEALETFEQAVISLEKQTFSQQLGIVLVELLQQKAWFCLRFGQLEKIDAALKRSGEIYEQLDIPPVEGYASDPRIIHGFVAMIRGNYQAAEQYARAACQEAECQNHRPNRQFAYYLRARAALAQGQIEEAERHAKLALDIAQEAEDDWFSAHSFNILSDIATFQNNLDAAKRYSQTSYELRHSLNHAEGMALALNRLGDLAIQQALLTEAKAFYEKALSLHQNSNDYGGLAKVETRLADADLELGYYDSAQQHICKALEVVSKHPLNRISLRILVSVAHYFLATDQTEHGSEILAFVNNHPASDQEIKTHASRLHTTYANHLVEVSTVRNDLKTTITTLLTTLTPASINIP